MTASIETATPGAPAAASPERRWPALAVGAVALVGLWATSRVSYLLFHALAETFSVVVAFSVFTITWTSRRYLQNAYLLVVGVAYLFLGLLDLLHTLAYQGMAVFPDHPFSANQLWIAARGLEAVTVVAAFAAFHRERPPRPERLLAAFAVVTAILVASIFWWRVFPACFVAGQGQTPFKIAAEYVIIALLGLAAWLLRRHRDRFHVAVYRPLLGSLVAAIACEFAFTLYVSNFGLANLAGHFLKIASYFLVHRALIEVGLRQPYDLVFRDLAAANARLRSALEEIKTLRGIIPICSHCKKIRNDTGSWDQLEAYLADHAGAQLSHGICPDCLARYFPEA